MRLVGFSTHYNVSFDLLAGERSADRTVEKLALLLTYLLPAPVMLLAANRQSTGIGVRPRGNRIEVTADFTPDAALMIATATVIVGIVREVMTWPSLRALRAVRIGAWQPADLSRFCTGAAQLAQGLGSAPLLLSAQSIRRRTWTMIAGTCATANRSHCARSPAASRNSSGRRSAATRIRSRSGSSEA